MQLRRTLHLPITLAVIMIVLLVALTVGWIILLVSRAINSNNSAVYWTLLTVGATFFVVILVGVLLYLTLSIKAINITKRQSNFIDSVTHELKSPIASLKLYLQTLSRRDVSLEEQREFYGFMLEDVDRLDQLINHVLDAARLDKPTTETKTQRIRLDALLRHCAEGVCLRYQIPTSTIDMDLMPCTVEATKVDLELIFRNLIDNAAKYAGQPPEITVTVSPAGKEHLITRITDNGRGIPAKLRRKIFGRFVRLGTELERDKSGTGLGLYIVRTLVGRLRGKIRVHGRENASGTVFEVTLRGGLEPALDDETLAPDGETDEFQERIAG